MLATLIVSAALVSSNPVVLGSGSGAKISPDGKYIAYLKGGIRLIEIMSIDGKIMSTSHQLPELTTALSSSKKRRVFLRGLEWSNNGKLLYVIQSEEDLAPSTNGGVYWFLNKSILSSWKVSLDSTPLLSDRKELDSSTDEIHESIRRDILGGLSGVARTNFPEPEDEDIDAMLERTDLFQYRVYIHNTLAGKTQRLQFVSDLNDVKLLPLEQGMLIANYSRLDLRTQKGKSYRDNGATKFVDASKDGDVIVYAKRDRIKVYKRSTEKVTEIMINDVCHSILGLSVSSDGSTIVFNGFLIKNGEDSYESTVFKVASGV